MSLPALNRSWAIGLLILGWMVWTAIWAAILTEAGWPWRPALTDAALQSITLAMACYATHSSLHFFRPTARVALLTASLTAVCAYGLVQVHIHTLGPLVEADYLGFCKRTMWPRVVVVWLLLVLTAIPTLLWAQITDQHETAAALKETEKLAREAELNTLRQQLQPHFIFNSLNSITALVGTQPEKARTMVHQLSDFLRSSLRKDDKTLVPLRDELHILQLYLEIEKVRFGHRLYATQTCDPDCLELQLPALLLQPIMENAIKYGLYDMTDNVVIALEARRLGNELELVVKNPYDPATSDSRKGTGFGLRAVSRRLYLLYGRNDLLQTYNEKNVFIATVRIPQSV
jgi:two-component system LytT family sensor kinase